MWGQPLILLGFCLCGSGPGSPRVLSVWIRTQFFSDPVCVNQGPVFLMFCLCGSGPSSPHVLSVWIRARFSSGSVWIRARFSSDPVCVDQDPVLTFCLCGSGSGSPQVLSVWIRTSFSSSSVCVGQGPGLPQALSVSMVQGWFWSGSAAQCRQCGGPQLAHPEPQGCGAVSTFAGRQSVLQARALRCRLVWLSLGAED